MQTKKKKITPHPPTTQSLQNNLTIKADSETLHQFQECFQLLTDFSAAGSGPPSADNLT